VLHRIGLLVILTTGCASYEREHQAQLEAAFPPGKMTRATVHSHMSGPDPKAPPARLVRTDVRPSSGWPESGALDCERSTRKRVAAVEYWMSPCGTSFFVTLCRDWFYFDDGDVLACVSEYQSD
jgi:hypothetical protein